MLRTRTTRNTHTRHCNKNVALSRFSTQPQKKHIPRHDVFAKYAPQIWTYNNKQSDHITEVDHTTFEDVVVKSKEPLVLDMFCDDRVECNMLSKNVAPVIEQMDGKVKLAAINATLHSEFLEDTVARFPAFEITAFPVLFAIQDGKVHDVTYGYKTQKEVAKWIKETFGL